MSKKVLILTGDAVEALEAYYPYYRCLEEGYDVTIASPTDKKVLHTVVHDFEDWQTFTEKRGYQIEAHASFEEIDPAQFDALIIPGGRAPEHIRLHKDFGKIASHFFQQDKPIMILCHASVALTVIAEDIKGREMTAYFACRPEVEAAGAKYMETRFHVDRNLISGHAWNDLPVQMKEFVKQVNAQA
ncbi:DJ-1/PfpI family protein [Brevibacillus choshinensis]|uniref:DJ-1/PfpI family protein n=1 Tax=Brevibacillus choshinensis TaxID=54911 RepID=A0ABX7FRX4_BRECH|nr:DJ-1/PfpI family protein [Brevibacillus choshinensis]QRG68382.1 DJ-1/PfpI family protein [Brevibacillus choshinensis]